MLVANQMSFYVLLLFFIIVIFILFYFFFHDKRLPIDNVYFNNYDAPVNREPFEAVPLLIYPCFTVEKLVNSFLGHEYEQMTKTFHAPSIRFTHI